MLTILKFEYYHPSINFSYHKETIHKAFCRWNHHQKLGQPKQSAVLPPSNEILTTDLLSPVEAMTGPYNKKSKGKLMIMTESTVKNSSEKLGIINISIL
jgi:hypothetical protein